MPNVNPSRVRITLPVLAPLKAHDWSTITQVNKFGRNGDLSAATAEDVTGVGGTIHWPATAQKFDITSGSANDDSGGSGAITVQFYGLDSAYAEQNETVTLNGTATVQTTNTYLRMFRGIVRTAGAGGQNAGIISATPTSDATAVIQIGVGFNQSLFGAYTVPAGKTAYMLDYYWGINKAQSSALEMSLYERPLAEVFQLKHIMGGHSNGASSFEFVFHAPRSIAAKTDIKLHADVSGNNVDVSGGFDLLLVSDSG